MKNETDFDTKYTYDISTLSSVFEADNGQGGMFETYSPDIDHILSLANDPNNAKRIWTMIDGDDGMYLIAGYHLVNRIYYIVTMEEWTDEDEEYLMQVYDEDEDSYEINEDGEY
jgi:hypothetical protein